MSKQGVAFILIIGLVLGVGASFWYVRYLGKFSVKAPEPNLFQASALAGGGVFSLTGEIKDIKEGVIVLDVITNLGDKGNLKTREVRTSGYTKIIRYEQKSPDEARADLMAWERNRDSGSTRLSPPPLAVREKEIKISDLRVGDIVYIESGENIETKKNFEVAKVIVQ